MKYKFHYKVTALDLCKLSMYGTYHSIAGVCNILFTVAMIFLSYRFLGRYADSVSVLLLIGCMWFPLIQPAIIYMGARRQAAGFPDDMEMGFDENGIHIITSEQRSDLAWKEIRHVFQKAGMIVLSSGNAHGYLLTGKMLGKQKEEFAAYAKTKIRANA